MPKVSASTFSPQEHPAFNPPLLNPLKPMKNYLPILISILPSYFAYFCELPVLIIIASTLVFALYSLMCIDEEPYQGAREDNKTMWLCHIIGTMLITALLS